MSCPIIEVGPNTARIVASECDEVKVIIAVGPEGPVGPQGPWLTPRPRTYYIRSSDGDDTAAGTNPDTALETIDEALSRLWALPVPTPWVIELMEDIETAGEHEVPDFVTILGRSFQRRTIVSPIAGNEERNVFLCGNGTHLVNLKFTGWRIDNLRNPTKGFAMAFRPGAIILPGGVPYGQNCVVTAAMTTVPTPLPMDPYVAAPTQPNPAHPRGGGCVLADARVLSGYSVFPNIMTWGFTPSSHNGLGYVAKNGGFINAVNAIGVGAHRHFMCINGGQMVASACSSQFGDFSFWSEGFTQRIAPLRLTSENTPLLTTGKDINAATAINAIRTSVINNMWAYLVANHGAGSWPTTPVNFETLTKKDAGLFLDAIAASLVHGFERPMENFAEGLFKFGRQSGDPYTADAAVCVYTYPYHAAFKASWDHMVAAINAQNILTNNAEQLMTKLVECLKFTMDNYWFEVDELTPAPARHETVHRKLRSLVTAIGHQWTAPMAGVEFYRVPPARAARRIQRSIRQVGGGRVRFSGQDDAGNAVFVGGLTIDARSGQLGGPPFDSALRGRLTRGVISRSY